MSVYLLALLRFKERAFYDRYASRFMEVFSQFNGRLLAADEAPIVTEGKSEVEKIVMMEFPDAESARAFANSPEYTEIAVDRLKGADVTVFQFQGLLAGSGL